MTKNPPKRTFRKKNKVYIPQTLYCPYCGQCRQLKKIRLSKSVNFDLFLLLLLIFKSIFVGTILE